MIIFSHRKEDGKVDNKKIKKIVLICILLVIVLLLCLYGYYKLFYEKKSDNKKVDNVSEYSIKGNGLQNVDLKFLQLESEEKNIIYSPMSIKYALKMLSDASSGNTKKQIDMIVGNYDATKYENNENIAVTNVLFVKNTFKSNVKDSYISLLKSKYNAEVLFDKFENSSNINTWIKNNSLGLIENVIGDIKDQDFFLINTLGINMEWKQKIQCAIGGESECLKNYAVTYFHEKYYDYVPIIGQEENSDFNSIKFNNSYNSKAAEIAASINKYNIVQELGESNIREEITKEYKEYLNSEEGIYEIEECKKRSCSYDPEDVTSFVEKFISELNENYNKAEASTDFKYYIDDDVKVFAKELKKYGDIELEYVGIMPIKESLKTYIKNIDSNNLKNTIDKIQEVKQENYSDGKVYRITGGIPFFKYDYDLNIISDLNKLNIIDIFNSKKADLSSFTTASNSYISDMIHKANIEFSNDGIKASAVTIGGGMGDGQSGFEHLYDIPVEVIDLNFDKPFMYIIRNKNTNEVLFTGTVYEPIKNDYERAVVINSENYKEY